MQAHLWEFEASLVSTESSQQPELYNETTESSQQPELHNETPSAF